MRGGRRFLGCIDPRQRGGAESKREVLDGVGREGRETLGVQSYKGNLIGGY